MATNLAIDEALLEEAQRAGGHRTKKAAVVAALQEYVRRHRQQAILKLRGQIPFREDYDHRALRSRR